MRVLRTQNSVLVPRLSESSSPAFLVDRDPIPPPRVPAPCALARARASFRVFLSFASSRWRLRVSWFATAPVASPRRRSREGDSASRRARGSRDRPRHHRQGALPQGVRRGRHAFRRPGRPRARRYLAVDAINLPGPPRRHRRREEGEEDVPPVGVTAKYLLNSGLPVADEDLKDPHRRAPDEDEDEARRWSADHLATQGMEYEHVAGGVTTRACRSRMPRPRRLAEIDGRDSAPSSAGRALPLEQERARLLREIGVGLDRHWGGSVVA